MTKPDPPLSQRAYARHRGVRIASVQAAISSKRLVDCLVQVKGVNKIISTELADAEWDANTRQSPEERADDDKAQRLLPDTEINYTEARRRKEIQNLRQAKMVTEQNELAMAQLRGDLVSKSEVTAALISEYSHVRTKLLGLPTRCRQRLQHLSTDDVKVITSLVREALEGLADGN